MDLKIKKLNDAATIPTYATDGSAGLDCYATENTCIYAAPKVVPLGFAIEVPEGYEATVRGRSGLAAQGIMAHMGTIDSDYRGEVKVMLYSLTGSQIIKKGDRIAQLVISPIVKTNLVVSAELATTKRGSGGLGSTGK